MRNIGKWGLALLLSAMGLLLIGGEAWGQTTRYIKRVDATLEASQNGKLYGMIHTLRCKDGGMLHLAFVTKDGVANQLQLTRVDKQHNPLWTVTTDKPVSNARVLELSDGGAALSFSYNEATTVTLGDGSTLSLVAPTAESWETVSSAMLITLDPDGKKVTAKSFNAVGTNYNATGIFLKTAQLDPSTLLLDVQANSNYKIDNQGNDHLCNTIDMSSWGMNHKILPMNTLYRYNLTDGAYSVLLDIKALGEIDAWDADATVQVTTLLPDGNGGVYLGMGFTGHVSFQYGSSAPIDRACKSTKEPFARVLNGLLHIDGAGNSLSENFYEITKEFDKSNQADMSIQQMAQHGEDLLIIGGGIGKLGLFDITKPEVDCIQDVVRSGQEYETGAGVLFHYAALVDPSTMAIKSHIPLGVLHHGRTSYAQLPRTTLTVLGDRAFVTVPFDHSLHTFGGADPLMCLSEETDHSKRINTMLLALDLSEKGNIKIEDGFAVQGKLINRINSVMQLDDQTLEVNGDAAQGTQKLIIDRNEYNYSGDPNNAVSISMAVTLSEAIKRKVSLTVSLLPADGSLGKVLVNGQEPDKITIHTGESISIEAIGKGEGSYKSLKVNGQDITSGTSWTVPSDATEVKIEAVFEKRTTPQPGAPEPTLTPVAEEEWNTLRVSPNPFTDFILVENGEPIEGYTLFDAQGNIVIEERGDRSGAVRITPNRNLGDGIYILQLRSARGVKSLRLLKQGKTIK